MRKRQVFKVMLACLGIIAILTLQGSPRVLQVLSKIGLGTDPVNTIQAFYAAVGKGDWREARALTTWDCWHDLEVRGQIKTWQTNLSQDRSWQFTGFTVQKATVQDRNAAIEGRAVWVSAVQIWPRSTQTVLLTKDMGGWRISKIDVKLSAQTVETFYSYLNSGQWNKARELILPDAWQSLAANQTLARVRQAQLSRTPIVSVYLHDVQESTSTAKILADLVWLNSSEVTVPVEIEVVNTAKGWVIKTINGTRAK